MNSAPEQCYAPGDVPPPQAGPARDTSQLKFVIALLPDAVHTHQPVLFDQFAVAIQEGAQDAHFSKAYRPPAALCRRNYLYPRGGGKKIGCWVSG